MFVRDDKNNRPADEQLIQLSLTLLRDGATIFDELKSVETTPQKMQPYVIVFEYAKALAGAYQIRVDRISTGSWG